jgi:hypothetical protein
LKWKRRDLGVSARLNRRNEHCESSFPAAAIAFALPAIEFDWFELLSRARETIRQDPAAENP